MAITYTEKDLDTLISSGKYSDFTVRCADRVWRVHRAIVCTRSKYFEKICDGDFRVCEDDIYPLVPPSMSRSYADFHLQEAKEATLDLEDTDPDLVERMLLFLYSNQYPSDLAERSDEKLILHAHMYAMADRFDVRGLKSSTRMAFELMMNSMGVDDHEQMPNLLEVLTTVYNTTPDSDRGLRDVVKNMVWRRRIKVLRRPEIQTFAKANKGFGADIMDALLDAITVGGNCWCRTKKMYVRVAAAGKCGCGLTVDHLGPD